MRRIEWCGGIIVAAICLPGAASGGEDSAKLDSRFFDSKVAPILAGRCLSCHSGKRPRSGLDLSRKEAALSGGDSGVVIHKGKAEESLLWKYVSDGTMPPKKPLPPKEKQIIKRWIDGGAVWGASPIDPFRYTTATRAGYDWWSLQPVRAPKLPPVKQSGWVRNPIDRFILAKLEAKGLTPSPRADRRTLIRRLYFDLLGLPPSPEEVSRFVNDPSPDAYEKLVDRVLDSPHYGERWARHWLDIARFGESNGFEHDELRRNAWPYRDWLISAFNADMPYDRFAALQIAGDVLEPENPQAIIATGFLVAGGYDSVGQAQQSQAMKMVVREDELEDIASTTAQAFLGMTVHCARCHDHKFDPIPQVEYYRFTAALDGVRHGSRKVIAGRFGDNLAARRKRIADELAELRRRLQKIEAPVRDRLLASKGKARKGDSLVLEPLAQWDFTKSLTATDSRLELRLHGQAKRTARGLVLPPGGSYAASNPIPWSLQDRTLSAWVQLDRLDQRRGAVISIETLNGSTFDAIVYAERQPRKWMAGSDFFRRTRDVAGPLESQATTEPVHIAITYAKDGTIAIYRNGRPYGQPYRTGKPVRFAAGRARLLFGLRHSPPHPSKLLTGTIIEAAVFDRALSASEIAALAARHAVFVTQAEIEKALPENERRTYRQLHERIATLEKELAQPLPTQSVYACTPRPPGVRRLLLRGNPKTPDQVVRPGGVRTLSKFAADFNLPPNAPDAERRKKLALWLTHPKNPLFARVMVNRLWHYHFGTGIVSTPNDFGFNGSRPSHPDLLDWLAAEFIRSGFRIKAMHRLMVTSATYRQQSKYRPKAAAVDADNRLLWRMTPRRLEAEAVRDAVLAVAGQLNSEMGGPGYQDFRISIRGATYTYIPIDPLGKQYNRRSIYRTWARSGRNPMLDVLDCPDPSTTAHRRQITTTPLQALTLLNGSFMLRMAKHFADRIEREAGRDVKGQVRRAFVLAYGREPSVEELRSAEDFVRRYGTRALCRAIFNSNEFLYVD